MNGYPKFYKIKLSFPDFVVEDIEKSIKQAVSDMALSERIRSGDEIAITAGSRGITNIPEILKLIGNEVKTFGAKPFLVAAMGSHGGGQGPGMLNVLGSLGITEDRVKMKIKATDKVVYLKETESGFPVYCAEEAYQADGIIIVNRVKTHTAFHGPHESGLFKMLSVGLGRAKGAVSVHSLGPDKMAQSVYEVGKAILNRAPVVGGIAIVENGNEETAIIKGCKPDEFEYVDSSLLEEARKLTPSLPVKRADLLIIQEMGKNYSGTGIDTNVIGRFALDDFPDPKIPDITRIVVLNLSDASHGNANGVGLADFITKRLFDAIDLPATYLNGLTTNFLKRIKIPVIMPDDQQAIEKAWVSLRLEKPEKARVLIIHNTLNLNELYISEALLDEVVKLDNAVILSEYQLMFNNGTIVL